MAIEKKLKYAALCIGINEYDHNDKLTCAENDAKAIAQAFIDLHYDVITLIGDEATYGSFGNAHAELLSQNFSKHYDAIILYFAGHGFVTNGSDCLALKDTKELRLSDGIPAKAQSIVVQDFIDTFRKRTAPVLILILDACRHDLSDYADAIERGPYLIKRDTIGKCVNVPTQTFIAYSTSYNKGAKDGVDPAGHSKYTSALLEEIKKELPIESIFKNVRSKVYQNDEDQLPWEYTCLTDEFFFNFGQLDPYYNAEYCKEAFLYVNYQTDNKDAMSIVDRLKKGDKEAIENALTLLLSTKGNLNNDDLFVIGRYIYHNAARNIASCQKYLTSNTIKLFGTEVNHLLRGIYYEIYFDENDTMRSKAYGNIAVLTIVDNLQRIMKDNDAAKFVKQYVDRREGNFIFEIWDTTTMLNVDVVTEDMYCSDRRDNIIYGVRNVVVDGEEIISKMQLEVQDIVTKDQLRQEIAKVLSVPSRRLKIKGLENEGSIERRYMMFYVDEIEYDLMNAINDNLPDEIVLMSSNSYVDELYSITIDEISYDGSSLTLEGSCKIVVHNEIDHEEMPNHTALCDFVVKLSEDKDSNSFKVEEGDFTVNTRTFYRQPDLFDAV